MFASEDVADTEHTGVEDGRIRPHAFQVHRIRESRTVIKEFRSGGDARDARLATSDRHANQSEANDQQRSG
jgi:hypothetical protein